MDVHIVAVALVEEVVLFLVKTHVKALVKDVEVVAVLVLIVAQQLVAVVVVEEIIYRKECLLLKEFQIVGNLEFQRILPL